ncbi:uncharacterized protein LOC121385865 [Gigantopelta aegis]|uniref:uncharacterized protein LOC121385865 n=1 Tax=Gigantopelta aegis TaxID=1735272 RepID=UPI001B88D559|nr:uncharacterized protein LOC121385865 [Gigantopelta aegis]
MIRRTDHDYRRGNQWNYVSWAVIVALFAILSAFTYLKFHEDRRVDGIIDALAATCETTEPERMGKCFKELLSNRANSGTFQQFHLDELKEKVKNLEASLGYPAPDSGEFRELSARLDEVTEQQKETTSLLEKTKTDVSSLRTELTELDQRMNEKMMKSNSLMSKQR